jgi:hypothetical protein
MMPSAIAARTQLNPMNAGGTLLGVLFVCVLAGALIGWAAGPVGIGIAIGAVVGIPAAIATVYRLYRSAF